MNPSERIDVRNLIHETTQQNKMLEISICFHTGYAMHDLSQIAPADSITGEWTLDFREPKNFFD
jgi:hypothetical protein